VRLIRNETNHGFAAANNQGIRVAQAPLIMLLNNDAYLAPNCLQKLVEAAAGASWAGMFACKILQHDAPDRMDSAGIEVDRAGIAWNRGWGEPAARHTQALEVFGPSGAAALYRRAMLDQIGLLDGDFFAYYEDVDLAWRAQWAGWRCLYVPEAEARHVHSATSGRGSALKARLLGRNKWWAIAKNYPFASLWYYAPLLLTADVAAVAAALVRDRNFSAVRGRWEALQGWRRMWRKRSEHARAGAIEWRRKLCAVRLVR
jgi:GT2 family glycosyltransferase